MTISYLFIPFCFILTLTNAQVADTSSCYFWQGPRTGGVGSADARRPCGSQCHDKQGSYGYHVPDGARPRVPYSWPGMQDPVTTLPVCHDICGVRIPYRHNDNI